MQTAMVIAAVWTFSAAVVAIALWKDRERAPDVPLQRPLPHGKPAAKPARRRRRASSQVPTYPIVR